MLLRSRLFKLIQRLLGGWYDVPFLLILLIAGNLVAYHFIVNHKNLYLFYQNEFAPAVMEACGYEFANPVGKNLELNLFLKNEKNTFECKDISYNEVMPLNYFQSSERYMLISAGVIWKFIGVGWDKLIPLFLLLYSITMTAMYFIFRFAMGRSLSLLFASISSVSSLHLWHISQLRDYSVAPFLLWLVWIAARLVLTTPNLKQTIFLCSAAGIVLGVGLGFRVDLLVLIPFFMFVLLLFVKVEKNTIYTKLSGVIAFFLLFMLVGAPILNVMHEHGSYLSDVIILGLADSFTNNLGLHQPQTYSIIPYYRDLVSYVAINSFYQRMYGFDSLLSPAATSYGQFGHYGNLFLEQYLYTFPADVVIRLYASTAQIVSIFIDVHLTGLLHMVTSNIKLIFPIISLVIISLYQLRLAFFVLFVLVYFGSYPVLQFDPRHYFYLEFIGWGFVGFLTQQVFNLLKARHDTNFVQEMNSIIKSRLVLVFSIFALCTILGYTLLILTRHYQSVQLIKLFNQYLNAKTKSLIPIYQDVNKKYVIKLPSKKQSDQLSYLDTIYLKINTTSKCGLSEVSFKLHYLEEPPKAWGAPQSLKVPTDKANIYFIPIYNYHNGQGQIILDEQSLPSYWIDYIEYTSAESQCIKNIAYVTALDKFPLLFTLKLQQGWEDGPLYQYRN